MDAFLVPGQQQLQGEGCPSTDSCRDGEEPENLGTLGRGAPRFPSVMTPLICHVLEELTLLDFNWESITEVPALREQPDPKPPQKEKEQEQKAKRLLDSPTF